LLKGGCQVIWAFCILVFFIVLLILPVGIDAQYIQSDFQLSLRLGPLPIHLLPQDEEKKRQWKEKNKQRWQKLKSRWGSPASEAQEDDAQTNHIAGLVQLCTHVLSQLRSKMEIELLQFHFIAGGEDPYNTAMLCGSVSAGAGALLPLMHSAVQIEKQDILIRADFDAKTTKINWRVIATLQVWEWIYLLCTFFLEIRKLKTQQSEITEERNR
jgi:hypothetical protein